jgi:CheY-like chemotaxis protein
MGKLNKVARYDSVLLIDDNDIDNFINQRIITSFYFANNVIVKNSALGALEHLKKFSDTLPNIIFLDLNMPIMDGFGFLEEFDKLVKANDNYMHCKIIVLSSSMSPDDINKASINPYVHKYINKPLTESYLEAINL